MSTRSLIITFAVLTDLVITGLVIRAVMKRQGLLQLFSIGMDKARALSAEVRDLSGNYIRANYSGNPDDLPPLLEQLLAQIDEKSKASGANFPRPVLKLMLANSLQNQEGVPLRDVQEALRKVA